MAKSAKGAQHAPVTSKGLPPKSILKKTDDYTSEGVVDHDIFLLPGSDYQIMAVVTVLAAIVRLFRIYQPSSVVFDEVQCVSHSLRDLPSTNREQLRWIRFQVH